MSGQAIKHMVIFNLKHEVGTREAKLFLQESQAILAAIPQVQQFEVFRQVSGKNDYDFGFSMVFADSAAYSAYNIHPVHVDYVKNRWEKEVTRFLEIDLQLESEL
ncbi:MULTISPECIES: Dabb family protein [unclassified Paenibacillus]|uniref:Dabb family protein n=1 Tax=unclassified Paenibacillus TaxID=185978 RepID=UPI0036415AA2